MHRIIDRFQINNSNIQNYDNNTTPVFPNNPDTLNSTLTIARTKGDANRFSIFGLDYQLRDQHYIGKIVFHIHNTDIWFSILQLKTIYLFTLPIISIIFIPIIYFTYKIILIKRLRKGRRKNNEIFFYSIFFKIYLLSILICFLTTQLCLSNSISFSNNNKNVIINKTNITLKYFASNQMLLIP